MKRSLSTLSAQHARTVLSVFAAATLSICVGGCRDQVCLPSAKQLLEFADAGPVGPSVDLERIVRAEISRGPYRVVAGEVIELTMPTVLHIATAEDPRVTEKALPFACRVSESGTITLPVAGEIDVAGKTLTEIEAAIVDAYYPAYSVTRPSVLAKILEYKTAKVSITGAVQKPGIYSLRSDQMSLVALLMEAGGIVENGAAAIRIIHSPGGEHRNDRGSAEVIREWIGRLGAQTTHANLDELIEYATLDSSKSKNHDLDRLAADYASFPGVQLQMSFAQLTPSGTTGLLTVKRDEKVVLVEQLDVSSDIQRRALSEELARKEPGILTAQVERELCLLAAQLGCSHDLSESKTGTILAQGTADPEQQISTLSDEALEKLRDVLVEVLERERSLRKEGVTEQQQGERAASIVLPVKGLNIPFADVALSEGDTIIVEPLRIPLFSVIGLVNRPGNFPYPPEVKYNLMQALGFAGGLDRDAEPRYATIYRLKTDGTIASASFKIVGAADSSQLAEALNTPIKPNDIVAVEHTPRTRTSLFLQRMFSIHVGAYVPVWR